MSRWLKWIEFTADGAQLAPSRFVRYLLGTGKYSSPRRKPLQSSSPDPLKTLAEKEAQLHPLDGN